MSFRSKKSPANQLPLPVSNKTHKGIRMLHLPNETTSVLQDQLTAVSPVLRAVTFRGDRIKQSVLKLVCLVLLLLMTPHLARAAEVGSPADPPADLSVEVKSNQLAVTASRGASVRLTVSCSSGIHYRLEMPGRQLELTATTLDEQLAKRGVRTDRCKYQAILQPAVDEDAVRNARSLKDYQALAQFERLERGQMLLVHGGFDIVDGVLQDFDAKPQDEDR